jgi:MOSC domain-containing protein YiiM
MATGFEGDYHSRFSKPASRRQILLISSKVLNELSLEPGAVNENAVIEGLDVMSLPEGQRLKVGNAILEVTIPCEPCVQMERVRPGLKAALQDRRGMFVRVIAPGEIRIGDLVELWPDD